MEKGRRTGRWGKVQQKKNEKNKRRKGEMTGTQETKKGDTTQKTRRGEYEILYRRTRA